MVDLGQKKVEAIPPFYYNKVTKDSLGDGLKTIKKVV
jgi:hypothetical protein